MPQHETKICPACARSFSCKEGNIVHCQCQGIVLSDDGLRYLDKCFGDCLCRNCLQEVAAGKSLPGCQRPISPNP